MLTKSDLTQIEEIVDNKLEEKFNEKLQPMNEKIDQILNYTKTTADELVITQSKVNNHEIRISKIESHPSFTTS